MPYSRLWTSLELRDINSLVEIVGFVVLFNRGEKVGCEVAHRLNFVNLSSNAPKRDNKLVRYELEMYFEHPTNDWYRGKVILIISGRYVSVVEFLL